MFMKDPKFCNKFFCSCSKSCWYCSIYKIYADTFWSTIDQWQTILIFISLASMILGAVAAIGQTNIKRLIAYSSIGILVMH